MIRACLLTIFFVCASLNSAMAAPITHVAVRVSSTEGTIPLLVEKRIAASIQTVGNHVLLNTDDSSVQSRQDEYIRTIRDIVDRVLIGYTVESISLVSGPDAEISVSIRPWGQTIQHVEASYEFGSLPSLGTEMAMEDIVGSKAFIENILTGLPVDALDWANGMVRTVIEDELETALPEFYPHIVITPGAVTQVNVYFLPKLPVVRNVNVDVEAENLPKVIFLSTRKHIESRYAGLDGLPVAFTQRHRRHIEADLQCFLAQQWVIKNYKLRVEPTLVLDENTKIHLKSQTDFYDIHGMAYIDMSRHDKKHHGDTTVLQARLGRKLGERHEFYTDIEFMPGSVDWNFKPGYLYHLGNLTTVGYDFESEDDSHHLWFTRPLGGRWHIRYDRDMTNHDSEVGLTYRFHEYVGVEYILSDHDSWIRVIGYL